MKRITICLAIFLVLIQESESSKCADIPSILRDVFQENLNAGTALFNFTMNMTGIDLALNPVDNYTELYIDGNNISIVLQSSFAINILNPRPREPEPDTDETLSCNHSNRGDALPAGQIKNQLDYLLECNHVSGAYTKGQVLITIEPVNDYAPEFFCSPYSKTISELTPIGTTIFISEGLSYDPDVEGGISHYDIQETDYFGSDGRSSRGVIVVNGLLDYDFGSREHIVPITVVDKSTDVTLNTTTFITLTLEDGDDQDPRFSHVTYEIWFSEENATIIGSYFETTPPVYAYDMDFGINATVEYAIVGNDTRFAIDPLDGTISPKSTLDREQQDVYNLMIEAYQIDNHLERRAFAELLIYVTDVNDHPPEMSMSSYDVTVQEHLANGTFVGRVSGTDRDIGVNSEIAYVMEECNSNAIEINAPSGEIFVQDEHLLDREMVESITCKVYAQETQTTKMWSSNRSSLTVNLMDINDNAPNFTQSGVYVFAIPPELEEGMVVGQVEAMDIDAGLNAAILYSIDSMFSDDNAKNFVIDPTSGYILVKSNITLVVENVIEMAVKATDQAPIVSQRRSSFAKVIFEVDDTVSTFSPPPTTEVSSATQPYTTSQLIVEETSESTTDSGSDISSTKNPEITTSNDSEITEIDPETSSFTTEATTDETTRECVCPIPTTDDTVKPEDDSNDLIFIIVIALLSLLILFLLILLLCLLANSRHRYNERVVDDKGGAPIATQTPVQGIHWSDTKSLIAHEQYLAHIAPEIFGQLETETSTEGGMQAIASGSGISGIEGGDTEGWVKSAVAMRHGKGRAVSIGTDARSSMISNGSMIAKTRNSAIDEQESSIYHVPIDCVRQTRISVPPNSSRDLEPIASTSSHDTGRPRTARDLVIEVECEIPPSRPDIENEKEHIEREGPEFSGNESEDHDYAYLNPVMRKYHKTKNLSAEDRSFGERISDDEDATADKSVAYSDETAKSNIVPKLDLSTVCHEEDKKQFSYCREEETIEIDIPCDSPRSSVGSPIESPREGDENAPSKQTIFIEVTPASPERPELSSEMPPLTYREEEKEEIIGSGDEEGQKQDHMSIETLSDDDYVDMRKDAFEKPASVRSKVSDDVRSKNSGKTGDNRMSIYSNDDMEDARSVNSNNHNKYKGNNPKIKPIMVKVTTSSETGNETTSGISMLDDVIAEEERMSERNSSIYPAGEDDGDMVWFTFAGDDDSACAFDTVKRVNKATTRNPNARESLASSKAEMQIYADGASSIATNQPSSINTNANNNQSESSPPVEFPPYSLVDKNKKSGKLNRLDTPVLKAVAAKMAENPSGTIRSNISTESTVKVINDLPEEDKSHANSDLYRDHTFFTSGGPVTFL